MKKLLTALFSAAFLAVVVTGCSTASKNTEPPPAPEPKMAPAPVAPADSDGDGVTDDRDKCPNTPKGTKVDADGCPVVMAPQRMEIKIEFDFDSAEAAMAWFAGYVAATQAEGLR